MKEDAGNTHRQRAKEIRGRKELEREKNVIYIYRGKRPSSFFSCHTEEEVKGKKKKENMQKNTNTENTCLSLILKRKEKKRGKERDNCNTER